MPFTLRARRCAFTLAALPFAAHAEDAPPAADIVVTASRVDMLGKAATASQGTITREEVELRPIYRPGQLYESIPGLVVTIHSGEGKAQQYLIRGYNLDHGTDLASFVDDMPVNRPTNTHGQGYCDLAASASCRPLPGGAAQQARHRRALHED